MIKKKKQVKKQNKISVKCRSKNNPGSIDDIYVDNLIDAYRYADLQSISSLITYLKQGLYCDDCDQSFYFCNCEKCQDCGFKRCLCDEQNLINLTDKEKIRKEILKIAKFKLNDVQLLRFNYEIKRKRLY